MSKLNSNQPNLSIKEAAEILNVSSKTLRRWEDAGKLVPFRTKGGHRRYSQQQLADFKAGKSEKKNTPVSKPVSVVQNFDKEKPDTKQVKQDVVIPAVLAETLAGIKSSLDNLNSKFEQAPIKNKAPEAPIKDEVIKPVAKQKTADEQLAEYVSLKPVQKKAIRAFAYLTVFAIALPLFFKTPLGRFAANQAGTGITSLANKLDAELEEYGLSAADIVPAPVAYIAEKINDEIKHQKLYDQNNFKAGDFVLSENVSALNPSFTVRVASSFGSNVSVAGDMTIGGTTTINSLDTGIVSASNGVLSIAETINGTLITADSLDFSELADELTLDADTTVAADGDADTFTFATGTIFTVEGTTNLSTTTISSATISSATITDATISTADIGTADIETLEIDGSEVTASASEINKLDGLATVTGGVYFSDGSSFAQDATNFYWDNTNSYLGIGTAIPAYPLDVVGDVNTTADYHIGGIGLTDTASATTSGAYLIGVYDEFDNSSSANVQDVLDDLDAAITSGGGSAMWTLNAGILYPTDATNDFAIGGTSSTSPFFYDESAEKLTLTGTTGNQLRLAYDTDSYTDFTIGSDGSLVLAPNGSTALTISDTKISAHVPTEFLSSGDVTMNYDLILANQTASSIYSYGPMTIAAGESYESNDLTLKTYNNGAVVLDTATLTTSADLELTGLSSGTDDTILTLNSSNIVETREIDPSVWGTSVVTATGTANYIPYFTAADTLGNSAIYQSGSNIGIGTTDPGAALEIRNNTATIYLTDNNNSGASATSYMAFYDSIGDRKGFVGDAAASNDDMFVVADGGLLRLGTSVSSDLNHLVIDSTGNIGVGTTDPDAKLEVVRSNAGDLAKFERTGVGSIRLSADETDPRIVFGNQGTETFTIGTDNGLSDSFIFSSASDLSDPLMTIQNGGNVGIGTTDPSAKLHIYDALTAGSSGIRIDSLGSSGDAAIDLNGADDSSISLYQSDTLHGQIRFDRGDGIMYVGTKQNGDDLVLESEAGVGHFILNSNGAFIQSTWAGVASLYINKPSSTTGHYLLVDSTGSNGGDIFKIDNTGNVGIGTTDPRAKLEISSATPELIINKTTAAADTYGVIFSGVNNVPTNIDYAAVQGTILDAGSSPEGALSLSTYGSSEGALTERVRIDNSGNVGIGTTAPAQSLHISGAAASLRLESTSSGVADLSQTMPGLELISSGMNNSSAKYSQAIKFSSTDPQFTTTNPKFLAGIVGRATEIYTEDNRSGMALDFLTTANTAGVSSIPSVRMTIDQSGNVGIGTTDPQGPLHIKADSPTLLRLERDSTTDVQLNFSNSNGDTWTIGHDNSVDSFAIAASDDNFETNSYFNIERTTGNVGIGTTSPGYHLDIIRSSTYDSGVRFGAVYHDSSVVISTEHNEKDAYTTYQTFNSGFFDGSPWFVGVDDSDSAKLKLVNGSSISSSTGITIDTSGNVGIGTTAPDAKLYVQDTSSVVIKTNLENASILDGVELGRIDFAGNRIGTTDASGVGAQIIAKATAAWGGASDFPAELQFWTAPNSGTVLQRMTITRDGNVGIGTTDPSEKLSVYSDSYTTDPIADFANINDFASISISDNDTTNYISSKDNTLSLGSVNARDAGNLNINSAGRVGIGIVSPTYKLDVAGDINFTGELRLSGSAGTSGQFLISQGDSSSPIWQDMSTTLDGDYFKLGGNSFGELATLGTNDNYNLAFETNGTTAMTIDTSGNVGIGTTSPSVPLHLSFNSDTTNPWIRIEDTDTTVGSMAPRLQFFGNGSRISEIVANDTLGLQIFGSDGASDVTFSNSSGNVGIGTTDPGARLHVDGFPTLPGYVVAQLGGTTSDTGSTLYIYRNRSSTGTDSPVANIINDNVNDDQVLLRLQQDAPNDSLQVFDGTNQVFTIADGGNVGIGTTDPGGMLNVAVTTSGVDTFVGSYEGTEWFRVTSGGTTSTLKLGRFNNAGHYMMFGGGSSANYITSTNSLTLNTSTSTTAMHIDSSGNVGIGTTSPENYSRLTLSGGGLAITGNDTENALRFDDSGGNSRNAIYVDGTTNDLTIGNSNYSDIVLTGGNVGIGTASPKGLLSIDQGSGAQSGLTQGLLDGGVATLELWTQDTAGDATSRIVIRGNTDDADIEFLRGASGSEVRSMFIEGTTGNVGIGTTSPSYKLDVAGDINFTGELRLSGSAGTSGQFLISQGDSSSPIWQDMSTTLDGDYFKLGGNSFGELATLGTNDNYNLAFETNGSTAMTIDTSGNVGIGTVSPNQKLAVAGSGIFSGSSSGSGYELYQSGYGSFETDTESWTAYGSDTIESSTDYAQSGSKSLKVTYVDSDLGAYVRLTSTSGDLKENLVAGKAYKITLYARMNTGNSTITITNQTGFSNTQVINTSSWQTVTGTMTVTDSSSILMRAGGGDLDAGEILYIDNISIQEVGPAYLALKNTTDENMADGASSFINFIDHSDAVLSRIQGSHSGSSDDTKGNLIFSTSNGSSLAESMRIDSDGNVGIGTTDPGAKLDVAGNIRSATGSFYAPSGNFVQNISTDGWRDGISFRRGSGGYTIGMAANGVDLQFGNVSSNLSDANVKMTILNGGNVGIGTTSPLTSLQVGNGTVTPAHGGGSYASGTQDLSINKTSGEASLGLIVSDGVQNRRAKLFLDDTNGIWGLRHDATSGGAPFALNIGGTELFRVTVAGNVGIGTTDPQQKLHISGTNPRIQINETGGNNFYIQAEGSSYMQLIAEGEDSINFLINNSRVLSLTKYGGLAFGSNYSDYDVAEDTAIFEGNVGIGTTSPSKKLEVYDANTANTILLDPTSTNYGIRIQRKGSVGGWANTGYAFLGGSGAQLGGLGAYGRADSLIRYFIGTFNTDEKVSILANGNVGIGTTAPAYKLDVAGDINFTGELRLSGSAGTSGQFLISQGDSSSPIWQDMSTTLDGDYFKLGGNSFGELATLGTNDNYNLAFETNGTTRMTIDTSGNVGIGTTSPTTNLNIEGDGASLAGVTAQLEIKDSAAVAQDVGGALVLTGNYSGGNARFGAIKGFKENSTASDYSSALSFYTRTHGSALTEQMRIDSSGNVGIGTTNPLAALWIENDNGRIMINSTGANDPQINLRPDSGSATQWSVLVDDDTNNNLSFVYGAAANTPSVVVDPSGNVGIGTTDPEAALHVNGDLYLNGNRTIWGGYHNTDSDYGTLTLRAGGITSGSATQIEISGNNADTNLVDSILFKTGNNNRMIIDESGNVGIGTTSPGYLLDVEGSGNTLASFVSTTNRGTIIIEDDDTQGRFGVEDNYLYLGGSGSLATSNLVVSAASAGNVGIGTTSPGAKLDVSSSGLVAKLGTTTHTDQYLEFRSGIYGSRFGYESSLGGVGGVLIESGQNKLIGFSTGSDNSGVFGANTVRMLIDETGNVGIGTTSPSEKLSLGSGNIILESGALYLGGSAKGVFSGSSSQVGSKSANDLALKSGTGDIFFYSGSAGQTMTVLNNGNVGIGTTSPGALLHVYGTSDDAAIFEGADHTRIHIRGTDTSEKSIVFDEGSTVKWMLGIDNAPTGNNNDFSIKQTNNGNAEFLINTAGNVGIGTTDPDAPLSFAGSVGTKINLYDGLNYNIAVQSDLLRFDIPSNTARFGFNRVGGSEVMSIFGNGNVGIGTTDPAYTLDVNGPIYTSSNLTTAGHVYVGLDGGGGDLYVDSNNGHLSIRDNASDTYKLRLSSYSVDGNTIDYYGNDLHFRDEGSTYAMTIEDSTGNVGIGTTDPGAKLQVESTIRLSKSGQNSFDLFNSGGNLYIEPEGSSNGSVYFRDKDNTNFAMFDLGNQRVGIGTTSPTAITDIFGTSEQLRLSYDADSYASFTVDSNGDMVIAPNGTTALTVSDSKISSHVPHEFLASGDVTMNYDLIMANQTASNITSYGPLSIVAGESYESNDLTLKTYNNGDIVFDTAGGFTYPNATDWDLADSTTALNIESGLLNLDTTNSRVGIGTTAPVAGLDVATTAYLRGDTGDNGLYVEAGGNVGIGTTDPSYKLHVNGNGYFDQALVLSNGGTFGGTYLYTGANPQIKSNENISIDIDSNANSTTNYFSISHDNGTELFRIQENGNVGIGTTAPVSKLDVAGTSWLRGDTGDNGLYVEAAGNVGIGTTDPDGILHLRTSSDSNIVFSDTGASDSTLTWKEDSGTTIKANYNALEHRFKIADSETMRLNSNGLGIGTTSPQAKLDVAGTSWLRGDTGDNGLYVEAGGNVGIGTTDPGAGLSIATVSIDGDRWLEMKTANDTLRWEQVTGGAQADWSLQNDVGEILRVYDSADDLAVTHNLLVGASNVPTNTLDVIGNAAIGSGYALTSAPSDGLIVEGNVGIGTTDPGAPLSVSSNVNILGRFESNDPESLIAFRDDTTSAWTQVNIGATGNDLVIKAGAAERMRINSSGNVGIGTTSPDTKLDVNGTVSVGGGTGANALSIETSIGTYTFNDYVLSAPSSFSIDTQAGYLSLGGTSEIRFKENGTERMRIDGGNVGIGTTDPSYLLDVTRSDDGVVAQFTDSDGSCTVDPLGGMSCSSDARLKKDIEEVNAEEALDTVLAMQGIKYHGLSESEADSKHFGFIAQDVEAIAPELVVTNADGYKALNYDRFAPLLAGAIQTLNTKHETLEARVDEQQIQIDELGNLIAPEPMNADEQLNALDLRLMEAEAGLSELQTAQMSLEERVAALETAGEADLADSIVTDADMILLAEQFEATDTGIKLNIDEIDVTDINVIGDATLGDVTVTGDLTVGTMLIDGMENSIDAVGTLSLQPMALGSVEIMGGLVTIDTEGNITAVEVTAEKYNVAGASAGVAMIEAGETEVFIETESISENSLVFVTAKTQTDKTLAVTEKEVESGFTVKIASESEANIEFDWWIVDRE